MKFSKIILASTLLALAACGETPQQNGLVGAQQNQSPNNAALEQLLLEIKSMKADQQAQFAQWQQQQQQGLGTAGAGALPPPPGVSAQAWAQLPLAQQQLLTQMSQQQMAQIQQQPQQLSTSDMLKGTLANALGGGLSALFSTGIQKMMSGGLGGSCAAGSASAGSCPIVDQSAAQQTTE